MSVLNLLEKASLKRVRKALETANLKDRVIKLKGYARTPAAAAGALGVETGAVVKTAIYFVGDKPVLVLLAGDHACKEDGLSRAFNLAGEVRKAFSAEVKAVTGYNIGCVPPVALAEDLPMVMDVSLKRFDKLYAPAGHGNCMFEATVDEIKGLTGCLVSYSIAEPAN